MQDGRSKIVDAPLTLHHRSFGDMVGIFSQAFWPSKKAHRLIMDQNVAQSLDFPTSMANSY
jgi:hypothetical protein